MSDEGPTDQRDHLDAVAVAEGHQGGAGIGHGRQARLGHQAHVLPVEEGQQGLDLGRGGVLVEHVEVQLVDVAAQPVAGQEAARRAQLLHDEASQAAGRLQDALRQGFSRLGVTERRRYQVEFPRIHFQFGWSLAR